MAKLELRESRLAVLMEIDRLDNDRCDLCTIENGESNSNKSLCKCVAAVKIRRLGDKLMKLVAKRKSSEGEVLDAINLESLTIETLTVELYGDLKLRNMGDAEIRKTSDVEVNALYKWKIANGMIGKRVSMYG